MPTLKLISNSTIRTGYWTFSRSYPVRTIVSKKAFYLVPHKKNWYENMVGARYGFDKRNDLLRGLVAKYSKRSPFEHIVEIKNCDLSDKITGHREWPQDLTDEAVIVLRKDGVYSIKCFFSWFWWRTQFTVMSELGRLFIFPPFFKGPEMIEYLKEAGWEL